ncbi:MAG: branched-chain amino acid ABC transporter permease [Acidimicrobiales bacterium]
MAVIDIPSKPTMGETVVAWLPRAAAWGAIAGLVLGVPLTLQDFHSQRWSLAIIFSIAALSLNVLIGYAGQISLGHQGFLGIGAFISAYVVSSQGQSFWVGLAAGALSGAVASLLMGVVALRVRGLYLALVTLAYGRMAQESLFNLEIFGRGAGVEAPRPEAFTGDRAFYYLTLMVLAVVLFLNWRFVKSKAGRAVNAIRENDQVASSYGIPVSTYKLIAFMLSGVFVGLAGALFAFRNARIDSQHIDFNLALFLVIVTVVGGLRSPVGIVVWTSVFQLLPDYLSDTFGSKAPFWSLAAGAALLVVILVFFPGGIGQLIKPLTRWLGGGPFARDEDAGFVAEGVRGRP